MWKFLRLTQIRISITRTLSNIWFNTFIIWTIFSLSCLLNRMCFCLMGIASHTSWRQLDQKIPSLWFYSWLGGRLFHVSRFVFPIPFIKKKVFELPLQRKKPKNPTIIWSMKLFGLSNYCQISLLIWVIKYCRRISNLQSSSTWYRQKQSPIQPTFKKKLMVLCQVAFKMRNIGKISEPTVIRSIWQWWYSVSHA